jgi:hypothetical protein
VKHPVYIYIYIYMQRKQPTTAQSIRCLGCGINNRGLVVRIPAGVVGCFFPSPNRPTGCGIRPASCSMGTGNSAALKRSGCEVDHSPPCNAEVKSSWSYSFILLYSFLTWLPSNSSVHPTGVCGTSLVVTSLPLCFVSRELSLL